MNTYTADEVFNALQTHLEDGWSELKYNIRYHNSNTIYLRDEPVTFSIEDEYGGSGQGEEAWVVVRVGDQLFRQQGWYASHYGFEWDGDFEEVLATTKTITVYEPKR